jgi:hypothetical protein
MSYRINALIRYALGSDIAGRSLAVRPDDTFLVSYPRSGNTWTRFLIANLLHPNDAVSFANIERLIPDCEAHSNLFLRRLPSPRVIKSHEYFDHRYRRVIYIVRDPRDVALSYYNFQRKYRQIPDEYPLTQYVSNFVSGRINSADWGTWAENVGTWLVREGDAGFLLLRYEDMMADPVQALAKVARFFTLEPAADLLAAAVERSAAPRLRELERTQGSKWVATKGKRPDIPFIGPASSGGWKSRLPAQSVAEIESAWGQLMKILGYELTVSSLAGAEVR